MVSFVPEVIRDRIREMMIEIPEIILINAMGRDTYKGFMSTNLKNHGEKFCRMFMSSNYLVGQGVSGKFYYYDKTPDNFPELEFSFLKN